MEVVIDEKQAHDLIKNSNLVRNGIANILNITNDFKLVHEDRCINGIIADFTLIHNNKIRSIIEVKGGNINVTDYVRGIGQIFQYEYFNEENISPRSIAYDNDFNTVYTFPSSVIKNNMFNVGRFKYPESTIIAEINANTEAVRIIAKKELDNLAKATQNNIVTISQYYLRDNRIFEYYILLRHLLFCSQIDIKKVDRKIMEEKFLRKIESINNNNWRNAFITLASLGLITSQNLPTEAGKHLAILEYEEFAEKIYSSYISSYANEIIECFGKNKKIDMDNRNFIDKIKLRYRNRDVLFLTQSDGRYISSWLNIFKDDYGFIKFKSRESKRILAYNPKELSKKAFCEKIKEETIAFKYIENYKKLIKNKEWDYDGLQYNI